MLGGVVHEKHGLGIFVKNSDTFIEVVQELLVASAEDLRIDEDEAEPGEDDLD